MDNNGLLRELSTRIQSVPTQVNGHAAGRIVDQVGQRVNVPKSLKRLYALSEAADYLGRSMWSVRRLIWNGELPSVRAGGRVHVDVRDMDKFIDKYKVTEEG